MLQVQPEQAGPPREIIHLVPELMLLAVYAAVLALAIAGWRDSRRRRNWPGLALAGFTGLLGGTGLVSEFLRVLQAQGVLL